MSFLRKRSRSECSMNSMDDDAASLRRQRKEEKSIRRHSGESSNTQVTASDFATDDSCVLRDFPKHKSAHLQFLSWVAYTRKYTLLPITDEERRTCPLLWCREEFIDQEAMLRHVWNCEHLAKGLYWCFQCQKPETVGKFKCKRCHGSHSKTDRIATVARKMFSALGSRRERCLSPSPNKAHHLSRISEGVEEPSKKECSQFNWIGKDKRQSRPRDEDCSSILPELSNTGICEMEAVYVSEMDADWHFSQELPNSEVSRIRNEPHTNLLRSKHSTTWSFISSKPPTPKQISPRSSRFALPKLDTSAVDLSKISLGSDNSYVENPMSATIVSPLSPTGGFDFGSLGVIDISPTDSEASGKSLFTDSGYSSATFESSWNGSDINLDSMYPNSSQASKGKGKEIFPPPIDYLESDPEFVNSNSSIWGAGNNDLAVFGATNLTTTHSAVRCTFTEESQFLSPHWSDAQSLVRSFNEVLTEHLQHSRKSLQEMAPNSITRELLSLSSSSIVSIGFGVLEGLLQGRPPSAVMPLFAFTHIAYALTIAIDDDKSRVQTPEWFQDLLSMLDNLSSDRQRQTYTQIARVIWQPRDATVVAENSAWANSSIQCENRLVQACKHFLDIQESFDYRAKMAAIRSDIPDFNFVQESFAWTTKSRIIDELIKNNATVAFIEDVASVDNRLAQGLIFELRQVELELICAGKHASQSETLYRRFLSHVTTLCDALYHENQGIKSRTQHHLEAISRTQQLLPQEEDIEEEDRNFSNARAYTIPQDEGYGTMENMTAEDLQTNIDTFNFDAELPFDGNTDFEELFGVQSGTTTPFCNVPLQQIQHTQIPSSQNTYHSDYQAPPSRDPTPPPEKTSGTQTLAMGSKYRCHCGYEPEGEEKWKASNMARHKRIQHATRKYTCGFRGCKSTFTRSDNLRSHQRDKGHVLLMGVSGEPPDVNAESGEREKKKRRVSEEREKGARS